MRYRSGVSPGAMGGAGVDPPGARALISKGSYGVPEEVSAKGHRAVQELELG